MRFTLLEPLRGLAALWVFAYHYDFSPPVRDGAPLLNAVFRHGHLGVPMFFVISGFCLAASAAASARRAEPWTGFLYRRARRIYPTYWASVAVAVAVPFVLAGLSAAKGGGYHPPDPGLRSNGFLSYTAAEWAEVVTLTRVFDSSAGAGLSDRFNTLNAVYWTLAIEVQFYLVMALSRAAGRRGGRLLGVVTVAALCSLPFRWLADTGFFLWYWPQFWFGTAVYWLLARKWTPSALLGRAAGPLAALGILAAVGGFVGWVKIGRGVDETAFALGFAAVAWLALALDDGFRERVVGSRWRLVRWLAGLAIVCGLMSYSIYLVHGRVRLVAMQLARQFTPADSLALDVGVFAITLAVCYAFYWVCERPFVRPAVPADGHEAGRGGGSVSATTSVDSRATSSSSR
jgi:peptidoglycan/LPS O-acetylase OafA/YrhL